MGLVAVGVEHSQTAPWLAGGDVRVSNTTQGALISPTWVFRFREHGHDFHLSSGPGFQGGHPSVPVG